MMKTPDNYNAAAQTEEKSAANQEISLDWKKITGFFLSNWKKLGIWVACGFVLGCVIAISRPHKFEVVSKIAPELSYTSTSRMSSLASVIGMSSLSMGSTDAIYPMVYPDLLHSPNFIVELFDTPVSFEYKKEQMDTTLFAYLSEYQKGSIIGTILSLPGRIMALFEKEEEGDDIAAEVDAFHLTKKQGRVMKAISKSISAQIDKRTLILTVSVTMSDPLVCATVARAVNDNLKRTVTKYRTQKAVNERDYYQQLYNRTKAEYYKAQEEFSLYYDSHQSISLQSAMMEQERKRTDLSILQQNYNSAANQLQAAQAKISLETPVFAEIIQPTVPLISKDSRKRFVLVFTFLSLCCGIAVVYFKSRTRK